MWLKPWLLTNLKWDGRPEPVTVPHTGTLHPNGCAPTKGAGELPTAHLWKSKQVSILLGNRPVSPLEKLTDNVIFVPADQVGQVILCSNHDKFRE